MQRTIIGSVDIHVCPTVCLHSLINSSVNCCLDLARVIRQEALKHTGQVAHQTQHTPFTQKKPKLDQETRIGTGANQCVCACMPM